MDLNYHLELTQIHKIGNESEERANLNAHESTYKVYALTEIRALEYSKEKGRGNGKKKRRRKVKLQLKRDKEKVQKEIKDGSVRSKKSVKEKGKGERV